MAGRSGGAATFLGTDTQASVAGFVAVHMLARWPLNWLELDVPDVPVAFQGETEGPGDDIRIELLGTSTLIEAQSKHGLKRGPRFDDTFATIARELPKYPEMLVVVVVDQSATMAIRVHLQVDLQRIAQGRSDSMYDITEDVRELTKNAGGDELLARVRIVEVNVDYLSSSHALIALSILRQVLDDPTQAETAWDLINRECHRICKMKGRQDYKQLSALLSRRGVKLRPQPEAKEGAAVTSIETADIPQTPGAGGDGADDKRVASTMETTKELLDAGKDSAALAVLEQVEPDVNKMTLSPSVRAGFYARLGATLMRVGRWQDARNYLARALEYLPTHFGSLLNLGLVEMSLGADQSALGYIDRALSEQPLSALAWASRADIASRLNVPNDPPKGIQDDPEYLSALANAAIRRGDWAAARHLAQEAIRKGPRDINSLMAYAVALYNDTFDTRIEGGPPTPQHAEVLKDVERITTEVIELLDERDQRHKLADALVLRGAARRALREIGAEDDLLRALRIDDGSADAAYQLAILRIQRGDATGAIGATDVGPSAGGRGARVLVMRARALLALGKTQDIEQVLETALANAKGSVFETEVRVSGADIAIDSGLLGLAERLVSGVTDPAEVWLVHLWRARIALKEDRSEDAQREYREAIEVAATDTDRQSATAEFAVYLSRRGLQQEAISYFQRAGADSNSAPEEVRAYYARTLYEAGELARADALLESVRASGASPSWALEIDARIARRQGDANREATTLEKMLALKPGGLVPTILLADAYSRSGQIDKARSLIDTLAARTELLAVQRLQVAELALRVGNDSLALPLAFDALRADPDDQRVHLAYVNIFMQSEARGFDFDETVVKPNTVAILEGVGRAAGETLTYTILQQGEPATLHGEYLATDSQIADLLGRKVGDEIVHRAGLLSERTYRISEVKNVFVHAFQDVLKNFGQRFPTSTALQAFKIGDASDPTDLAFLVQSTSEQAHRITKILALHTSQLMPLGAVARLASSDIPTVMGALATSAEFRLNVELGSQPQYEASVTVAADDGPAVLSRSALVTAQALDLLSLLKQTYPVLIAPAALVQEVEAERAELARGVQDGLHRIGSAPGHGLVMQETSAAEVRQELANLEQLLQWIAANCEVAPRPLSSFGGNSERLRETLGAPDFDSYAIAADRGVRLYADDLGLRSLAETEQGVEGFSTWAMVTSQMRGRLSNGERDTLISRLIEAGHYFVPLNAELLYHRLEMSHYSVDGGVLRMLDRLSDPNLVLEAGVSVVAQFIRKVALSVSGASVLQPATRACLEALARNRAPVLVAAMFLQAMQAQLALLPVPLDQVRQIVRDFINGRFGQ